MNTSVEQSLRAGGKLLVSFVTPHFERHVVEVVENCPRLGGYRLEQFFLAIVLPVLWQHSAEMCH